MEKFYIALGKTTAFFAKLSGGAGATWPGHIVLNLDPNFIHQTFAKNKTKIILVAGTNGKTTTGKLITSILEANHNSVFQNTTGANLLNGIASTLVRHSSLNGRLNYDYAVFEIDEATLPLVLQQISPDYLILLNLFRDQLDRYGEVNSIAQKWQDAVKKLDKKTTIVANADDPQIAYISTFAKGEKEYFGVEGKTTLASHNVDSTYCPKCGTKLNYSNYSFSHLGNWQCPKCKFKRPKVAVEKTPHYPLPGIYNQYNTHAAVLLAKILNINLESALSDFKPAFGRQEIVEYQGKKVQLFLSKNPTSFNESMRTMIELEGKHVLFVLNDRIPDGHDVSWIWDTALEDFIGKFQTITVAGDRAYDMALRIQYAGYDTFQTEEDLKEAIEQALKDVGTDETLYILPTYSAMLEVREILTGRKIL